jgi:inner membrane protein
MPEAPAEFVMDTLTHGLLGVALAALTLPRRLEAPGAVSLRAAVVVSVLAAELPDLDYLLPAKDVVLHTLSAHRGYSHSLLAAPAVALLAALLTKALFRRAAFTGLYMRALISVPLAHLLPDLWTGWGTRLFLPLSDRRLALDWTMVVDPVFTGPLFVAALYAIFRRERFQWAMGLAGAASALYIALRIALSVHLTHQVACAYPGAVSVHVFPELLSVTRWRYVARFDAEYAIGTVALGEAAMEAARHRALPTGPVADALRRVPTVREALSWARFPVVSTNLLHASVRRVTIADLRYHLSGKPTLAFVIEVGPDGRVQNARLDRGGSAEELLRRFRENR